MRASQAKRGGGLTAVWLGVCLLWTLPVRGEQPAGAPAIIQFDAPGAGTAIYQGTLAYAVNEAGTTAGFYIDANGARHAFVRTGDGTITTFDAPGAGTAGGQGTLANAINGAGDVTRYYSDRSNAYHGFIRSSIGNLTTFDVPSGVGTLGYGINRTGDVTGSYLVAGGASYGCAPAMARSRDSMLRGLAR